VGDERRATTRAGPRCATAKTLARRRRRVYVEFDRDTCIGMFQCVAEWDRFESNPDEGKATLVGGEATEEDDVYRLAVPEGEEFDAKFAARVCPVDAIAVYEDDGERLI
jgi:ferredoxin